MHLYHRVVCGMTAGALGQFVASPTDLVKVKMQMEGKRLLALPPHQRTRAKSMVQTFYEVLETAGIRGLWKGCIPNVQRAALVNLGDLTGYDQAKTMFVSTFGMNPESRVTHVMSSIVSGLVAATMGTPADVIKTRVMNQPFDERGKGILHFM